MSNNRPSSVYNCKMPQPNDQWLAPDGTINRVWYYWMISIMQRTGGSSGISSATLQAQIDAIYIEEVMEGDSAPRIPLISVETLDSPLDYPPNIAGSSLLAMALGDAPYQMPLDPLMAALLVSDAT